MPPPQPLPRPPGCGHIRGTLASDYATDWREGAQKQAKRGREVLFGPRGRCLAQGPISLHSSWAGRPRTATGPATPPGLRTSCSGSITTDDRSWPTNLSVSKGSCPGGRGVGEGDKATPTWRSFQK